MDGVAVAALGARACAPQTLAVHQSQFFLHQVVDADAAMDLEVVGADRVFLRLERAPQRAQGIGDFLQCVPRPLIAQGHELAGAGGVQPG